jgi:hypothetical protein
MICRIFVLFDVVGGRVSDLLVTLNLDNEDFVALLDKKIGAKFSALWLIPLLPCILDPVEANWGVL